MCEIFANLALIHNLRYKMELTSKTSSEFFLCFELSIWVLNFARISQSR